MKSEKQQAITLQAILNARDERRYLRKSLLMMQDASLIQITINSPGAEKNNYMIQKVFQEALYTVEKKLKHRIISQTVLKKKMTGPEAFLMIKDEALEVKRICCFAEEEHPLGRLWDIDVYEDEKTVLSRLELGLPPRSCLICSRPAHECARSQRHDIKELKKHISKLVQDFSG